MHLYICKQCLERSHEDDPVNTTNGDFTGTAIGQVLPRIRRFGMLLGGLLGGLLGLLSGNPVIILLGATAGSYLGSMTQTGAGGHEIKSAEVETCEACGEISELVTCPICKRSVCSSCRDLIMAEDERDGKRIYRHYEKEEETDEEGLHSLAPWNLSDLPSEKTPSGYQLGDEEFTLDEETGELIPIPEGDQQDLSSNQTPADQWDFDSASVSPPTGDWGSSDSWDSSDCDSSSWGDSQDAEGES